MIADVKKLYINTPAPVKSFLLKGIIAFVAWQLAYHFLMQPRRVPDRFFTDITTIGTVKLLSFFYQHVQGEYGIFKDIVWINNQRVIGIADPCNALELYALYIGFLCCFPATWKRRLIFTAIGVPVIFVANAIRCAVITWLNIKHPTWVDISHHYIFTTLMYLLVFYGWFLFSKSTAAHAS
jgi:exosortase/archaeosortase family protein